MSLKLKIGIPKGSLQNHTLKVFKLAGLPIEVPERGYFLRINDPQIECFLLRPQEIPKYVQQGKLDAGITGDDWILENRAKVVEVCDLRYAKYEIKKVKWVLTVPVSSEIKSIKDLNGKIISSEAVNLAKDYLKKNKIKAKVEFSWGATEIKPPRFADAAIDLTETGASLRANNLRVLDIVFESSTKLVANKKSFKDNFKREKLRQLAILLMGAVNAEEMVGLAFHIHKKNLAKSLKFLPSFKKPTITKITGTEFYDIFAGLRKKETRSLIPLLKKMGCQGIVEFPLTKVVP